ncbi:MAG: glutamine synthetase, partial [Solirubrobacteraceae bacterium]
AAALAAELAGAGVAGLTIAWADNNGIPRSRTVPVDRIEEVARRGVGITTLFAVFDTHDAITFAHAGLSTPSGDVRLLPVLERATRLAGQPRFAWAPGRQIAHDGRPWPYDQRGLLEAQVRRAAEAGLQLTAGYELEFFVGHDADGLDPAHDGPAYSPHALLAVDELAAQLLEDLACNGLRIGQLHAEYGLSQLELSLTPADPVKAADDQLLARQTIHAAARARGLRVSFAPLVTAAGVGNGWHLHTSVWRDGENLLAGDAHDGPLAPDGRAYLAGLLRDLPAVAAVTAPSVPSLARLRPGYFASAYAFWGIENREAALRYVPGSELLGAGHANVELKPSDASGNPYLALAAVIAAGVAGIEEGLELGPPIQENPGGWTAAERRRAAVERLPETPAGQEAALLASERVTGALGEDLLGAFLAVRRSDAAWAAERTLEDVVAGHLWRY